MQDEPEPESATKGKAAKAPKPKASFSSNTGQSPVIASQSSTRPGRSRLAHVTSSIQDPAGPSHGSVSKVATARQGRPSSSLELPAPSEGGPTHTATVRRGRPRRRPAALGQSTAEEEDEQDADVGSQDHPDADPAEVEQSPSQSKGQEQTRAMAVSHDQSISIEELAVRFSQATKELQVHVDDEGWHAGPASATAEAAYA